MDKEKVLGNVKLKQEPNSSTAKKVLLSSSSFAQLASKNASNTRLPSFKPPRDLFLTGSVNSNMNPTFCFNSVNKSSRKTYMPNVNVIRKKCSSESIPNETTSDLQNKVNEKDKLKKSPLHRKRNINVVQTKGVFSEGLAPGKIKAFSNASTERTHNERQFLEKPKLNLNKKIQNSEEDLKLKSLLKDDFIDDPSQAPDTLLIPSHLPMAYNVKPLETSRDLEKTFEILQVKTDKISCDKTEKCVEEPDIISEFETCSKTKMFLFEFPSLLKQKEESLKKKKNVKRLSFDADADEVKTQHLASLGEGFFGYLRIHKNGRAFLVVGKTMIPLCLTRHNTRQEIVSTSVDKETSKGEVISLGTIDASFTCSANFFHNFS